MCHVWNTRNVHAGFWWGDLRETQHLGNVGVAAKTILKWFFEKWDEEAWIESI
jgi:hypothetical protein